MAKSTRMILFIAADRAAGVRAQIAFTAAASRLGLPYATDLRAPDHTLEISSGVVTVVAVDLPDFALPNQNVRVEQLATSPALVEAVNKLLARLLGGDDQAVTPPPTVPPPPPKKVHTVKVSRETAGRKGKGVTVVSDLPLTEDQLKELATKLKSACGSGGTSKDGRIEIQGDHRDRLVTELEKLGYKVKRAGG
jgi:translation initiation factor 1